MAPPISSTPSPHRCFNHPPRLPPQQVSVGVFGRECVFQLAYQEDPGLDDAPSAQQYVLYVLANSHHERDKWLHLLRKRE